MDAMGRDAPWRARPAANGTGRPETNGDFPGSTATKRSLVNHSMVNTWCGTDLDGALV